MLSQEIHNSELPVCPKDSATFFSFLFFWPFKMCNFLFLIHFRQWLFFPFLFLFWLIFCRTHNCLLARVKSLIFVADDWRADVAGNGGLGHWRPGTVLDMWMAANDVPQLSLTPSVKDPHKSQLHLLDGFRGENAGNRFALVDFVILNLISIFFSWEYCYVSNFRGRSLPFHVTHSCSKSVKSLGGSVCYLNGWLVGWLRSVFKAVRLRS